MIARIPNPDSSGTVEIPLRPDGVPYRLEAIYDAGRWRAYADQPTELMDMLLPGYTELTAEERLSLKEQILNPNRYDPSIFEQTVPGYSMMFVLLAVIFGTATGMHDERVWGTLPRLLVAPRRFTAILTGKREADEILAGAAIGAVVGGGVGVYMDHQEEKLARIPGTTVERVGEDALLVKFQSDILFDVDSAVIDSGGRATLDQVAGVLVEYPKTAVVVQGHTDATGSEEHNLALSDRRANAVANHLIARGVAGGRISALGMGEGYPVADNDSASGRQLNRRVDILLQAKAR